MLTKEERKERNHKFWEDFRKKMRPIKSVNGRNINWINYPSDVKDIYIRLETDGNGVRLCFDIQPKDDGIRSILWEQMTELKVVMEEVVGLASFWSEFDRVVNGRTVSRICWENSNLSFYNDEDWVDSQNYLKQKLTDFDRFYQEYKEILVMLAG